LVGSQQYNETVPCASGKNDVTNSFDVDIYDKNNDKRTVTNARMGSSPRYSSGKSGLLATALREAKITTATAQRLDSSPRYSSGMSGLLATSLRDNDPLTTAATTMTPEFHLRRDSSPRYSYGRTGLLATALREDTYMPVTEAIPTTATVTERYNRLDSSPRYSSGRTGFFATALREEVATAVIQAANSRNRLDSSPRYSSGSTDFFATELRGTGSPPIMTTSPRHSSGRNELFASTLQEPALKSTTAPTAVTSDVGSRLNSPSRHSSGKTGLLATALREHTPSLMVAKPVTTTADVNTSLHSSPIYSSSNSAPLATTFREIDSTSMTPNVIALTTNAPSLPKRTSILDSSKPNQPNGILPNAIKRSLENTDDELSQNQQQQHLPPRFVGAVWRGHVENPLGEDLQPTISLPQPHQRILFGDVQNTEALLSHGDRMGSNSTRLNERHETANDFAAYDDDHFHASTLASIGDTEKDITFTDALTASINMQPSPRRTKVDRLVVHDDETDSDNDNIKSDSDNQLKFSHRMPSSDFEQRRRPSERGPSKSPPTISSYSNKRNERLRVVGTPTDLTQQPKQRLRRKRIAEMDEARGDHSQDERHHMQGHLQHQLLPSTSASLHRSSPSPALASQAHTSRRSVALGRSPTTSRTTTTLTIPDANQQLSTVTDGHISSRSSRSPSSRASTKATSRNEKRLEEREKHELQENDTRRHHYEGPKAPPSTSNLITEAGKMPISSEMYSISSRTATPKRSLAAETEDPKRPKTREPITRRNPLRNAPIDTKSIVIGTKTPEIDPKKPYPSYHKPSPVTRPVSKANSGAAVGADKKLKGKQATIATVSSSDTESVQSGRDSCWRGRGTSRSQTQQRRPQQHLTPSGRRSRDIVSSGLRLPHLKPVIIDVNTDDMSTSPSPSRSRTPSQTRSHQLSSARDHHHKDDQVSITSGRMPSTSTIPPKSSRLSTKSKQAKQSAENEAVLSGNDNRDVNHSNSSQPHQIVGSSGTLSQYLLQNAATTLDPSTSQHMRQKQQPQSETVITVTDPTARISAPFGQSTELPISAPAFPNSQQPLVPVKLTIVRDDVKDVRTESYKDTDQNEIKQVKTSDQTAQHLKDSIDGHIIAHHIPDEKTVEKRSLRDSEGVPNLGLTPESEKSKVSLPKKQQPTQRITERPQEFRLDIESDTDGITDRIFASKSTLAKDVTVREEMELATLNSEVSRSTEVGRARGRESRKGGKEVALVNISDDITDASASDINAADHTVAVSNMGATPNPDANKKATISGTSSEKSLPVQKLDYVQVQQQQLVNSSPSRHFQSPEEYSVGMIGKLLKIASNTNTEGELSILLGDKASKTAEPVKEDNEIALGIQNSGVVGKKMTNKSEPKNEKRASVLAKSSDQPKAIDHLTKKDVKKDEIRIPSLTISNPKMEADSQNSPLIESPRNGILGKLLDSSRGVTSPVSDGKIEKNEPLNLQSYASMESEGEPADAEDRRTSVDSVTDHKPESSVKLLDLAKSGDWTAVEEMLSNDERIDLSITDRHPIHLICAVLQHGFNVLLFAVKDSKVAIFSKLLSMGADLYSTTNDRRSIAHIAAMYSNEEMVECILSKGVDLSRTAGPHSQLPLHYACCRSSPRGYRVACLLLNARDERLYEDREKCLPINYAILYNNIPLIKKLLERNTQQQIKHVDGNGDTLLHLACRKSEDEIVQLIVDRGGFDVNQTNAMGWTALHEVACNGDEKALKIMIKLQADANIHDQEDRTPLHVAAERGHTQVAEMLIDKFGGSIGARTRDGSTLLHIAALYGHADTALAFLKRGVPLYMPNKRGAVGLHSAAAAGFTDVVRMLILRGTNVDIRTRDNYTALHVAVQSGRASVVETLLGFGADVHLEGGRLGETALHIAASLTTEDATQCAIMLLKSGAQPNVTTKDGETPLHIASRNPLPSMIRLLLSEGADPKLTSLKGESALHVASRCCNSEAVRLMLEHLQKSSSLSEIKKFVNATTFEEGLTAVHYAAEITHDQLHSEGEDGKLINTLIEYGGQPEIQTISNLETAMHLAARSGNETVLLAMVAKLGPGAVQIVQNKQSKSGWSPLLEACARGHLGVARILLKHHARVDVFDENGQTALHLAAANGHVHLTHLLLQHKSFVNSKSKAGEAPLHLAAQNGHVKVVNILVQDYGASLEAITLDNQTALHFAAKHGQLAASQTLLALGANPNARDDKGQTPLHLAAENDFPDVVKLFLKMKQNNRGVLTAVDFNGFTCAHIAAVKGSLAVVKELMMIDKAMVIQAKTKTMEATALHMAATGGHEKIVKILLENGANAEDENAHGMTALHLGAKNGFISILDVFEKSLWKRCSRKTGLNALHIAAYYGNTEFVLEMLKHIPANSRSEPPIYNHHVMKEFATEYGLTPLHLAAQSGHDSLVRMLLNQGVQVDATSTTMSIIPLHLAAQQGHIAVVGILLSRSTQQQHAKDWRGRTPLHLAAMNGHYEMVSLLIAQGSNINVMDQNGWTGMHYATRAGHINVVKLFVESSADAQAETKEGKIPLCFAAAHNHLDCLRFLLKQKHDTHVLMDDRKFIFDLMVCGKGTDNEPLKEFILQSPAPIDTAVKLSSLYRDMSEKEKERAKDLSNASTYAEDMAVELLSITASEYNAAILLKAKDNRGRPLLDVLIENEQKEVVSYASVQRYLTEIWVGRIDWSFGRTVAFALVVFLCPPAWFYFSLPLDSRMGRAPIIKFVCHIVSHVYFTMLLTVVVLNLTHKIYEVTSVIPNPVECVLLLWLSGNLVSELSNVGGGSGLGIVKVLILILSAAAIAMHILAFAIPALFLQHLDNDEKLHFARTMLYLKNQLFAFALLFAFVEFLDFLTVHHLFGPWAIIIRDLMYDLTRFLVILLLFIAGFTLHVTSIFQPAYQPVDDDSADLMRLASPEQTLEMLFFSLFGLVEPDTMPPLHLVPDFAKIILKLLFGIYLLVTLIVLINLLIAMMSDTYQRIQAQSDKEWKFGRAILIRQMNKRSATPAPINMLTKLMAVLRVAYRNKLRVCTLKAQQDLRYEEDIDAFSMNGDGGRNSPGPRQADENNEIRDNAELGKSADLNIETVIDWKRIVEMYYQANGMVDKANVNLEVPS
uniref:ANK_REP_REGION domain-containing protein n=1 Tax=Anisakis simplex TaxID=6269 RepID=A0A158PNG3_ANISI